MAEGELAMKLFKEWCPVGLVPVLMILAFNHIFSLYFGKSFLKIICHTIILRKSV